ncbi:MAG: PAS domain S-box protein [Methanotrichaceae archaeon]|nr:PAS domain S-box protein [Methanotrichaceae archaeon]
MDLVQLYIPILDRLSEAVHISDLMGRVIYLNPAFQTLTGCSLEEAKGRKLEEVFQGPNASVETRHLGSLDMPEAPIIWRRGSKAYRTTISLIPGPEGQIEYMLGSTAELDADLRGLDPSILQVEASGMLEQILSASPDLIAIFDRNLRFVYVSRSLSSVLDVEREAIIGKGLVEVLPSSDVVPEMEDQIEAVIQSGKGCDGMFSYALPRGARTFEYILSPVRDAQGEIRSVMATLRDVTERNRGEDALLLDEARLEALLKLNQMTGSDLEEIIAFALRAAVKLTNSKFGYLASIGPDGSTLHMHSWHFESTHQSLLDQDVEIPLADAGIWGEVLFQRRPVVENVVQDPSLAASPVLQDTALNRLMSVPIFDEERIAALAGVADKVEPYDDTDLRQLTLMMDGMWRLVQRKRLEDSIRQARDMLEVRVKERTLELDRVNKDLRKEIVGHTNTEIALQRELSRRRELEEIINRGPIVVFLRRAEDGWPVELVSESIEQFGYRPGDFHDGLTFSSIIHPDDRERVEKVVVSFSLPGIDEFTQIYRILTKLGEPRWVEDRSLVRRDDEGRITHYQGIIYDITERKEAEEELCSARQRLEHIIDFLPDATFAIDKDDRVIAWNRAMEEMTGVGKEEMIGKGDYAYAIPFYGKPRPMLIDFVGMAESEAVPISMERYLYRKIERKGDTLFARVFVPALNQGRGSHLWAKASLQMDDKGQVLGSIESMRDITDSVTAEKQLLKRDSLLTGVAVAANVLLTISDFESAVNQSLEMLGLAADAEKAYVFENQEDPNSGELFAERRFMWSRDGSGHEDSLSVLPLDGSFARWRSHLVRGIAVKGLARDFPPEEQEVLNKEGILSILAVPIVIDGRFWGFVGFSEGRLEREWDKGEVSILWVSAGSLGSAIMNKRSEEGLRNSEERFRTIFETAQDCIFIKDRQLRYVQVNPAVSRLFGIPMDEMVGKSDSDLFGSDAARYLSKLDSRVLEGEIVDEEYTKPIKGVPTTLHVVKVPIRDNSGTIIGLCGFARDITERKRIEVALKESERRLADIIEFLPDPTLVIDREGKVIAWNRAIVALTGIQAEDMLGKGDLHRILVSVEDTGIGIRPDRQSCLFQSFSQVDSTTTRKYGGTGLGLAISKRLVEMMGGRIWMESSPGKGSTFYFSIRARSILQPSAPHESIQGPSPRIKLDEKVARRHPLRILLAEDNAINQKVALKMLARMGYRADVAASGIEVLQALDRQRYDLILMDVQMPEMDGLETTERILSRWPKEERPQIIAMTAHALAADKERCLQSGMDDYVSKPVELQDLRSALERAAQRRASRPQTPALDQRILEGLRELQEEGEPDIVCELGELFMSNLPGRLESMRSALHQGDATALFRAAHDMKSSSANIGALRLSEICRQVEMMGRSGDLDGAEERLILIDMEISRVRSALLEEASCHPQDEPAGTK